MTPDLIAIESMLKQFAIQVSYTIGEKSQNQLAKPPVSTDTEREQAEEEWAKIKGLVEYHDRVEREWLALVRQRTGDTSELDAGNWPCRAASDGTLQ